MDERDAVTALGLVEVVRRHQHRHAGLRQRVDQAPELPPRQRIDAAGRLVEEEDRRLVQDGAPERQTLAPAAGQIARERILAPLQAGHLENERGGAPPAAAR